MTTTPIDLSKRPVLVPTGPAGRPMAEPMSDQLIEMFQAHLNMERQSSAAYFAGAIWFAERELPGFAHYLRDEANQEQQHAAHFADYLISRGQTVLLDTIEPPRQSWTNAEEMMATIFQMESEVTNSVKQLYCVAERDGDTRTTVFLDPIVDGQRQSEHEVAYLYGRVRLAADQVAALILIDNELTRGQKDPAKLSH